MQLENVKNTISLLSAQKLNHQASLEKLAQERDSEMRKLNSRFNELDGAKRGAERNLRIQLNSRGFVKRLFHKIFGESRSIKDARAQLASRTAEIKNHQETMIRSSIRLQEQIYAKRRELDDVSQQLIAASGKRASLEVKDYQLGKNIETARLQPQSTVPEETMQAQATPALTED